MPLQPSGHSGRSKAGTVHSKLRKLGLLESRSSSKAKQFTFELYFPRSPYRGAQYRAAKGKDGLYNFVGLVLGHGGATVQRIQKASGAKIEVRDSAGNLNGAHPSSHGDPSLHAWLAAASRQRLDKAVALLLEVLQPTNTRLRGVTVATGGRVVLEPVVPSDWPEAAEGDAAGAGADGPAAAVGAPPAPPPPRTAANAWASNRLQLKPRADGRQMSPTSSLQRSQAAAAAAESAAASDADEPALEPEPEPYRAAQGAPPLAHDRLPPPLPPPRSPGAVQGCADALPLQLAEPPQHVQQEVFGPPALRQEPMATVWATGLHQSRAQALHAPSTPSAPPQRGLGPEPSGGACVAGSSLSWSLWDQGSGAASFYEQLQAAASDTFLPGAPLGTTEHHSFAPAALAAPVAAPFPGLAPQGLGPLSFPPVGHGLTPSLDAEHEMQQLLAAVASMATQDG